MGLHVTIARGSTLMDMPGVGPVVAARILADVGDVARFADLNRMHDLGVNPAIDVRVRSTS